MEMRVLLAVSSICISAAFTIQGQDIPGGIANWAAPASWSPTRASGVRTLSDATNPVPFIGLPPCRILDTRGNGAPIQGGIFTGGADVLSYTLPPICGVATNAAAVSLNFTVTGPGQTTAGFLLAWPTGGAVPPVSILNWDHVPAQVANAAVVPMSGLGSITVNVSAPTHVIMDINGYYSSLPASPNSFLIVTSASYAIQGATSNTSSFSYGVLGITSSVATDSAGVRGQDGSGNPAVSASPLAAGVRGDSITKFGVLGRSRNIAVIGALYNSAGTDIGEGYLGTSFGTAADMTSG